MQSRLLREMSEHPRGLPGAIGTAEDVGRMDVLLVNGTPGPPGRPPTSDVRRQYSMMLNGQFWETRPEAFLYHVLTSVAP